MKLSVRVMAKALPGLVVGSVPSVILGVVGFKFHWPAVPLVWTVVGIQVVAAYLVTLRYCHPRDMAKLLETMQ